MHPISVLTKNKNYEREDNLMSLIFLTRTKEINKGQNFLLLCICISYLIHWPQKFCPKTPFCGHYLPKTHHFWFVMQVMQDNFL